MTIPASSLGVIAVHNKTAGNVNCAISTDEAFLKQRFGIEIGIALATPVAQTELTQKSIRANTGEMQ